jgi:hypothetical protein
MTAEEVRRVLRSWLATEVLIPHITQDGWSGYAADKQGQQRNRASSVPDGPAQWELPGDEDLPPWPILPQRPTAANGDAPPAGDDAQAASKQPRPWYSVVLGALPAKETFERLDASFGDQADEDETYRRVRGHVVAASAVLDEWGCLVPGSFAVASYAWGVGLRLHGGLIEGLAEWGQREQALKAQVSDKLTPLGPAGHPRSLTWRDLRGASRELAEELGLLPELWVVTPCAVQVVSKDPPEADILSSFLLADLGRVLREADELPAAAQAYLGLRPPAEPWDALTDRLQLATLLRPALFPLARWPGPGLHPLTLLQQAAVNAIVRDLGEHGIAAVNGPPGTGKTTLLRDLVAHVLVLRAETLAGLDPQKGLAGLDLMDFAIVVASSNNAAVENVSLELPVRGRALDDSVWREGGLDYFGLTATAVLGVGPDAPEEERAWGLVAARLGNAGNRRTFLNRFWWDHDWGLNDWLNLAGWPDAQHNRARPPGKLAQADPPPRSPEARAQWRAARDSFCQAAERCRLLRRELEVLSAAGTRLQEMEAQLPAAEERLGVSERDLASAARAATAARDDGAAHEAGEAKELAKLSALSSVRPSWFARLFHTRAWQAHEAGLREQVARLNEAQGAGRDARDRLTSALDDEKRRASDYQAALLARDALRTEAARLTALLEQGQANIGDTLPGPGFWAQPDDALQQASPWNTGAFRAARDALFIAAMRLHRAFIVAAARDVKRSLNAVVNAMQGGPDTTRPTATDWGVFFLVVPVVSTTFASFGRMFQDFGAEGLGWLLIDEAGQATPQAAVGAIWRARRAVVIGDPLQIEPVASTPRRTTRLIFEANGIGPGAWAAPEQSAQTLADRASRIQGRFPLRDAVAGREERVTGMPLLVHRRCERPMFNIANSIAYAERMVFATAPGVSLIRDVLGTSAWIDVDAPSADKWVEAEGRLVAAALTKLCLQLQALPDIYVICPFRVPARRLRALLRDTPAVLPSLTGKTRHDWLERRVGTIHTFQGKEAEAVILMLGAGRGARPGSRNWAGSMPNLLNVAATRAKRALYVVGNRAEWQGVGVFTEAASRLEVRSPLEWLPMDQVTAVS